MAQPIRPEEWQLGIEDNTMLPGRTVSKYGRGNSQALKGIANNFEARRVIDIVTSDYITTYDDRRINGHNNVWTGTPAAPPTGFNADGRDGWGSSSYGVFQDVHFDSKIYDMSRHRSMALRVFEEQQFAGGIGEWGTATQSNVITPGQAFKKVAEQLNIARKRWEDRVLAPDIDKYTLFCWLVGHMAGRLVGKTISGVNHEDHVFDGDCRHYQWVATPGLTQGTYTDPQFAPIHCIEWDDSNIPQLLDTISVTWNNLYIPQDNRVILMDERYRYKLMTALTGNGVPNTEAAYADIKDGKFERLMGWTFAFDIPSAYWPYIYVDNNLNVVHSEYACNNTNALLSDKRINSVAGTGDWKLLQQLVASNRMGQTNWMRTDWNGTKFVRTLTNYPLGFPGFNPWEVADPVVTQGQGPAGAQVTTIGKDIQIATWDNYAGPGSPNPFGMDFEHGGTLTYPFAGPGAGYGLLPYGNTSSLTGAVAAGYAGTPVAVKTIGCALYMPAVQCSQEYSNMVTDEGRTRGKFTEMCYDVKFDAWVIEQYSAGVIPIIDVEINDGAYGIPVSVISMPDEGGNGGN